MPFPVIADPELRLGDAAPAADVRDRRAHTLYKRLALVAVGGWIAKVFYPVFPPDRNAQDVVDWLRAIYRGPSEPRRSSRRLLAGEPAYRTRQVWEWAARGADVVRRDDEPPRRGRAPLLDEQVPVLDARLVHEARSPTGR